MKVIVAGSRDWEDRGLVYATLDRFPYPVDFVIYGDARGPDAFGKEWAQENIIPFRPFPAAWRTLGEKAGPMRNQGMVDYVKPGGALVAFWDGKSAGTADVIRRATKANLLVWVVNPAGETKYYYPQTEMKL